MNKDYDWTGFWMGLIVLVLFFGGSFWVSCIAPCDQIGWLPISETPARCLFK